MIKAFYYYVAWACLLFGWIYSPQIWLIGLGVGWFFHMIVDSIILHKYFTHKTFSVSPILHKIMAMLGTLSLNGSVLAWVNMHRLHHITSDKAGDPHNPRDIGFFKALFVFRTFLEYNSISNLKNCRDLTKDKWVIWLHKHCDLFLTSVYLVVGLISLNALLVLMIATGVSFIGLFFTTYIYHFSIPYLHYRSKDSTDNSHNNWLMTIIFPGEAYHNNHHFDASKYDASEKWWEFDLSSIVINLIKKG